MKRKNLFQVYVLPLCQDLVCEMFHDAVDLYLRVGAKEVLKDFKRCYLLKKTMAHRQMIMVRTEKKEKKKAKISLKEFSNDGSLNKEATHKRLKGSVLQFGDAFLWTVYTVAELKKLCLAADVRIPPRVKRKIDIARLLLPVLKETCMFKCPFFLDNLETYVVDRHEEFADDAPLRLKIRVVRS